MNDSMWPACKRAVVSAKLLIFLIILYRYEYLKNEKAPLTADKHFVQIIFFTWKIILFKNFIHKNHKKTPVPESLFSPENYVKLRYFTECKLQFSLYPQKALKILI